MLTAKHKFIMKEKILSAFKKLGFNLKPVDECEDCNHFEFEYEGSTYLYIYSPNDPVFFNVALPGVLHEDDEDSNIYNAVVDSVNSEVKYVKAYSVNRHLWIFYECEVSEDTDFEDLIHRVVFRIEAAYVLMRKKYVEFTSPCDNVEDYEDPFDDVEELSFDDDEDTDDVMPMSEEGYDLKTLFGEVSPDECVLSDEDEDDIKDKED